MQPAHAVMSESAERLRALSVERWGEPRAIEMVGCSPALLEAQTKLEKVARFREPVLITGESGAGKEIVAQALYLLAPIKGQPFVAVNCPQYQEGNLTVSELFGHVKGSFTGAVSDRKGAFEEAAGGVIFLDEIGDLQGSAQVMLLRTLSAGEFRPLGSTRARKVDVRVVSATNRPLNQLVMNAEFRYDLLYRLRQFHIDIPPLRNRGDDWRLLIDHWLRRMAAKYGESKRFSTTSLKMLETYEWPGNVRQLIAVVRTGYAMADADVIEPGDFASLLEQSAERTDTALTDTYQRLVTGQADFWSAVHDPFMKRDLNRSQVKRIVKKGLLNADGQYRRLLGVFQLEPSDYQRFMDFLRHHGLKP